jgi:hypothetical protein
MKAARGTTLGATLAFVALAALVVCPLLVNSVANLSFTMRSMQQTLASNSAESAVAAAIDRVLRDTALDFGKTRSGQNLVISRLLGARGEATFDPAEASRQGVGLSVNNLGAVAQVAQGLPGLTVPADSLFIVGAGWYGGETAQSVAILRLPPFDYALAANSAVRSDLGMLIGSLPAGQSAASLWQNPALLLPASIASNDNAADALFLGGNSYVAGNARAVGGIRFSPAARVRGVVLPTSAVLPLPAIALDKLDPLGTTGLQTWSGTMNSPSVLGVVRCAGPLQVDGDLTLDNGVLFVKGNLTVTGSMHGRGAVMVDGNANINGAATLAATDQTALVTSGDVTLSGGEFRGLVYTGGSMRANQVTMQGLFIANNPAASTVQLDQSAMIYDPSQQKISFTLTPPSTGAPTYNNYAADMAVPDLYPGHPYTLNIYASFKLSDVIQNGAIASDSQLLSLAQFNVEVPYGAGMPLSAATVARMPPGYVLGATLTGPGQQTPWQVVHSQADMTSKGLNLMLSQFWDQPSAENWILQNDPQDAATLHQAWLNTEAQWLAQLKAQLQPYVARSQVGPAGASTTFTLDINEFIAPADRARLMLWRKW